MLRGDGLREEGCPHVRSWWDSHLIKLAMVEGFFRLHQQTIEWVEIFISAVNETFHDWASQSGWDWMIHAFRAAMYNPTSHSVLHHQPNHHPSHTIKCWQCLLVPINNAPIKTTQLENNIITTNLQSRRSTYNVTSLGFKALHSWTMSSSFKRSSSLNDSLSRMACSRIPLVTRSVEYNNPQIRAHTSTLTILDATHEWGFVNNNNLQPKSLSISMQGVT